MKLDRWFLFKSLIFLFLAVVTAWRGETPHDALYFIPNSALAGACLGLAMRGYWMAFYAPYRIQIPVHEQIKFEPYKDGYTLHWSADSEDHKPQPVLVHLTMMDGRQQVSVECVKTDESYKTGDRWVKFESTRSAPIWSNAEQRFVGSESLTYCAYCQEEHRANSFHIINGAVCMTVQARKGL